LKLELGRWTVDLYQGSRLAVAVAAEAGGLTEPAGVTGISERRADVIVRLS